MMASPLRRATLAALPTPVRVPLYDPAGVRPGIVHLGPGGFHRAHMARYTHDLMNLRPDARRWGIIGVGLLPSDHAINEALAPQDSLYTLVERQGDIEEVTVIGSLHDVIFAGETSSQALSAIAQGTIKIVSLTVTENGYCLNRATRALDLNHPMIAHDMVTPSEPRSAIGILVEAYRQRRIAGQEAFTSMSCDNIQSNGDVLRDAVLELARHRDPGLAIWISETASFPNTMVDRITPATTPENVAELARHYGVQDNWPVYCEKFTQWVIEDDFSAGRPEWEIVGAQFVADVSPYEKMKLRLLNASHLAVAGLGRLIGYHHIDETLADEDVRAYMRALMDRETGPTLPALVGIDLVAYKASLLDRFANARIKDTVDRVNKDVAVTVLLDPIQDRLGANQSVDLLAFGLAAWCRRVRGQDDAGLAIDVSHPLAELLKAKAVEGGNDPRPLLSIKSLFGNLGDRASFVATLEHHLTNIYANGVKTALLAVRRELAF